ncbi:MAG: hypothetical protein H6713_43105, partial [Myxococcales bacterium]|nr:hypothetical protein [Myxococcales bacterium]
MKEISTRSETVSNAPARAGRPELSLAETVAPTRERSRELSLGATVAQPAQLDA